MGNDPENFEIQATEVRILDALLASCLGERLARKPRAEDVVGRDICSAYLSKVAGAWCSEVLLIEVSQGLVDLGCENALMPQSSEG